MSALETLANLLLLTGLIVTLTGLWYSTGGLRVVVSGRIDERRKSAGSLRRGLLVLSAGVIILAIAIWLKR